MLAHHQFQVYYLHKIRDILKHKMPIKLINNKINLKKFDKQELDKSKYYIFLPL